MGRPLSPRLKIIDSALDQWGRETKPERSTGLPAATLLHRVGEYGPVGAASGNCKPPTLSERSAAVDRALQEMPKRYRKAVQRWYWSKDKYNQMLCANRERLALRTFELYLQCGREFLADFFYLPKS
ncbi:MAG: hypothetical protein KGL39_36250 [Patescibacteria group bacterium]|nr:hypothetical protein [Patescibacteria group bacterium]